MKKHSTLVLVGMLVISNICSFNVKANDNTTPGKIISISQSVAVEEASNNDIYHRAEIKDSGKELEFNTLFHRKIVKNDIRYTFSNGVLTVTGTGIADDSYTKNCSKDSIKEVIVSEGIIGIADYAFKGCKKIEKISLPQGLKQIGCYAFSDAKLKELTIPATVNKIGYLPFESISKDATVTMPAMGLDAMCMEHDDVLYDLIFKRVKEINLNTNYTFDKKYIYASEKLNLLDSDPNYKSYDGVVYTKDGKKIVQVPRYKNTLEIRKGCTTFSLQAIAYLYDSNNDGAMINYCVKFKKITVPSTVKKIVNDVKYSCSDSFHFLNDDDWGDDTSLAKCKWTIKTKKLDGKSLLNLLRISNNKTYNSIIKDKKFKIKKVGDMYISKDGVLLRYTGKAASVTIPSNIKVIGDAAFSDNYNLKVVKFAKKSKIKEIGANAFSYKNLKTITIPKGCKTIGNHAFHNCPLKTINLPNSVTTIGDYAFYNASINNFKMPKNLKAIGDSTFSRCKKLSTVVFNKKLQTIGDSAFNQTKLKSVKLPDSVIRCGSYCFAATEIKAITLSKKMKEIPCSMCSGTNLKKVVIPGNIKKIGEYAFNSDYLESVELKEGVETIDAFSFYNSAEKNAKPVEITLPTSLKYITGNSDYYTVRIKYSPNNNYSDSKSYVFFANNNNILNVADLRNNSKQYCSASCLSVYNENESSNLTVNFNYTFNK